MALARPSIRDKDRRVRAERSAGCRSGCSLAASHLNPVTARLIRMRRWFAIILLALLPLQFSWAAVAAYCGPEGGQQIQHLGHHEHQHADPFKADADNAQADQTASAGFDHDCSHCHCTCAGLTGMGGSVATLTPSSHPLPPVAGVLRTLAQSPPERPQWLPLV